MSKEGGVLCDEKTSGKDRPKQSISKRDCSRFMVDLRLEGSSIALRGRVEIGVK